MQSIKRKCNYKATLKKPSTLAPCLDSQDSGGRSRRIASNSRPAWSISGIQGQSELHSVSLSQKTKTRPALTKVKWHDYYVFKRPKWFANKCVSFTFIQVRQSVKSGISERIRNLSMDYFYIILKLLLGAAKDDWVVKSTGRFSKAWHLIPSNHPLPQSHL